MMFGLFVSVQLTVAAPVHTFTGLFDRERISHQAAYLDLYRSFQKQA